MTRDQSPAEEYARSIAKTAESAVRKTEAVRTFADKIRRPHFDASERAARQIAPLIRLQEDALRSRQDLDRMFQDQAELKAKEKRDKLERETQALELSAGILEQQRLIVETQQAMLAEQIRQAMNAEDDRRQQRAFLLIGVLGIAVAVIASVAAATGSVFWAAFGGIASTAALGLLILLAVSDRHRPSD